MKYTVKKLNYYYTITQDKPGEAHKILTMLSDVGVNQLAFNIAHMGPERAQITLFPEDHHKLVSVAEKAGIMLDGPLQAILVQGPDELGALVKVHAKLHQAGINVVSSTGITDGVGGFGYIIYVNQDEYERAAETLKI